MVPIILISDNSRKTNSFIKDFCRKNKVLDRFIFAIKPSLKEFSIEQIREIKKNIIYNFSDLQLYILYDFDSASFEAQNAFLKTLEEHQQTIQFIMVVKNAYKLVDTILSRSKLMNLTAGDEISINKEISQLFGRFLASGDLKILVDNKLQVKKISNPSELFKDIVYFFRQRLAVDPKSTKILREVLSTKYLVENNNIDPQAGIDHLVLYIRQVYQTD